MENKRREFPVLPATFTAGRPLVHDPMLSDPVARVAEVPAPEPVVAEPAPPVIEEKVISAPAFAAPEIVAGIEGVARVTRIATPNLPLAKPLPSTPPTARILPYAQPRGFCTQEQ